jgi:hypothetical protein
MEILTMRDLTPTQRKRIIKVKESKKEHYVHLLRSGKIGIWYKPVINKDIMAAASIRHLTKDI